MLEYFPKKVDIVNLNNINLLNNQNNYGMP